MCDTLGCRGDLSVLLQGDGEDVWHYEAPSNEAPHTLLGYHQGRLMTYLQWSPLISFWARLSLEQVTGHCISLSSADTHQFVAFLGILDVGLGGS